MFTRDTPDRRGIEHNLPLRDRINVLGDPVIPTAANTGIQEHALPLIVNANCAATPGGGTRL